MAKTKVVIVKRPEDMSTDELISLADEIKGGSGLALLDDWRKVTSAAPKSAKVT